MIVTLKIILIVVSVMVLYQDLKERQTYWFWFPILAIAYGLLHLDQVIFEVFALTTLFNLCVISIFFIVIYAYAKLKLKVRPQQVFGLGDALLFVTFSFTFPTGSFISVFLFSLVFSLVIHLLVKQQSKFSTVPLAGYMCLFFAVTYVAEWCNMFNALYLI